MSKASTNVVASVTQQSGKEFRVQRTPKGHMN